MLAPLAGSAAKCLQSAKAPALVASHDALGPTPAQAPAAADGTIISPRRRWGEQAPVREVPVLMTNVFETFAGFGSTDAAERSSGSEMLMDGARFAKFCKDTGLLTARFTPTDVDLVFTRACAKGRRRLGFDGFEAALGEIARKKGVGEGELRALVAAADGPASSATAVAESGGVLDKLTDAAQYTGAHKARFDADGRGRGLAGRDPAPKGAGTGL